MPMTLHIRCSCGISCISGDHTMLSTVSCLEQYQVLMPPVMGSPTPRSTAAGCEMLRARTSRTAPRGSGVALACRQSSTKRSTSKVADLPVPGRVRGVPTSASAAPAATDATTPVTSRLRVRAPVMASLRSRMRRRMTRSSTAAAAHIQSQIWSARSLSGPRAPPHDAGSVAPAITACVRDSVSFVLSRSPPSCWRSAGRCSSCAS